MDGPCPCESGQDVRGQASLVGDGTGWPRGTLAQSGQVWWDGSRVWWSRQALWWSYTVDRDDMDTGKCRESGRNLLHCPPARPDRDYIKIWASGHAWAVLVA